MRLAVGLVFALFVACSDGGNGTVTPPNGTECTFPPDLNAIVVAGPVDDPVANAAPGTGNVTLTGSIVSGFTGAASGFEIGAGATLAVFDVFAKDAAGRPTAELFVFIRARATTNKVTFVPVTLTNLKNPGFIPPGSFAVYADSYDATAKDYTRWLISQSGCIRFNAVADGQVGRASAGLVEMTGAWQTQNGAPLGTGTLKASLTAPLLRLTSPTGALRDSMAASVSGARTDPIATNTLDAFQVLRPDQTRLVVVGSAPGEPSRELWLSLPGVPAPGDSVTLRAMSVDEAKRGRAATAFGLIRGIALVGIPPRPEVREVWPSTTGWVKVTNLVETGPLALCGWATGRFSFSAAGTDVVTVGQPALGTLAASGVFAAVFTVMAPADSLVDPATPAIASRVARLAAPTRSSGAPCNF